MINLRRFLLLLVIATLSTLSAIAQRVEVSIPGEAAQHGHLIVVFSRNDHAEPRFQLSEDYKSAQAFGIDVDISAPGAPVVVDAKIFGYPRPSLKDLEPGDYYVQAVFNRYEQFHLGSGKDVWLAPDKGEGQRWNRKPGNAYNVPAKVHLDGKAVVKLTLDQVIPPVEGTMGDSEMLVKMVNMKQLKYLRFKSEKLSAFWGRPTYLGAWILLPDGFEEHPSAKFPLVVYQDHFKPGGPVPIYPVQPGADAPRWQTNGYRLFQDWTSGRLPRVILMFVQNANPYYDDSYVVDSANLGPYGAAVNQELIPAIEKQYRGIGQGWARATYGGSTGGWEALATQVFYPDDYNGAYVACPDPVDFHGYQNIDLYTDTNAFRRSGEFGSVAIAGDRTPDGGITATVEGEFAYEKVLGTHGRSAEQWNIWQAVFSPAGKDGYPATIIDENGTIDKQTLAYWHDHYDMAAILKRDWPVLGPKLEGKLHFAVGDGDTFFLNNAVHLLEQQLNATRNPHSDATFQYGPGMPHCYTGGPAEYTMQQNGANWTQRVLPLMVEHMLATAPAGADVTSWRF